MAEGKEDSERKRMCVRLILGMCVCCESKKKRERRKKKR